MKDNSRENTPPPEPGRFRTRLDALLLEGLNSPIGDIVNAESVRRITERAIADAKRVKCE
jgi:glycosyltransferase A (GT-A) superfamily protein (DUF2064 family)